MNTIRLVHNFKFHKNNIVTTRINSLIQFAFYSFIFSIPFELLLLSMGWFHSEAMFNLLGSLSRLTGVIFIGASLLDLKKTLRIKSPVVVLSAIFIIIYLLTYLLNSFDSPYNISMISLLSFPWLMIIFIFCYGVLHDTRIRENTLIILMISIGLCALLQLMGAAYSRVLYYYFQTDSYARISAFGNDFNMMGFQYSVAILIAVLIFIGMIRSGKFVKMLSIIAGYLCLAALVQTGSRGAILSLIITMPTILFAKTSIRIKVGTILIISIVLVGLYLLSVNNPVFVTRFIKFINYGDVTNRDVIYKESLSMFFEKPFIGWGPYINKYILADRINYLLFLDTHNTFLWVLTSTGIIGFIPFLILVFYIFYRTFIGRTDVHGIPPLSLFILVFTFSQTVSLHYSKLYWLFLAFGASVEAFSSYGKRSYLFPNN